MNPFPHSSFITIRFNNKTHLIDYDEIDLKLWKLDLNFNSIYYYNLLEIKIS